MSEQKHSVLETLSGSTETSKALEAVKERLTLEEYLEQILKDARPLRTAYQFLNDMVLDAGTEQVRLYNNVEIIRYKFFDEKLLDGSHGPDAVFGIDRSIMSLMEHLNAAAHGYGQQKRLLLLLGPVGSAKSTIVRLMKRGMEKDSIVNPRYTFEFDVEGLNLKVNRHALENVVAPMNEDPLTVLGTVLGHTDRQYLLQHINTAIEQQQKDGRTTGAPHMHYFLQKITEASPLSGFYLRHLVEHYKGDWQQAVRNHVRVRRLLIDEKAGHGIGSFQPKDEKNQDSTELTGMVDLGRVGKYGQGDPRAFNFAYGEFCKANRGIMEMIEVLKLETAFLYELLPLTQENLIKPKAYPQIPVDLALFGHTNEGEYTRLQEDPLMEALKDRTVKIVVPYVLVRSEEEKIYRRDYGTLQQRGGKHVCGLSFEVAAWWPVLTRIEKPKEQSAKAMSEVEKCRLYNGEYVENYGDDIILKLFKDAEREGLDGLGPRKVQDAFGTALVDSHKDCVTPHLLIRHIERQIRDDTKLTHEQRKKFMQFSKTVESDILLNMYHEHIYEAAVYNPERKRRIASRYFHNMIGYVRNEKVLDEYGSDRLVSPNESFMREIERQIGVTKESERDFRQGIVTYFGSEGLRRFSQGSNAGKTPEDITAIFDYAKHPRLDKALNRYLFEMEKSNLNLDVVHVGPKTEEDRRLIHGIVDRMVDSGIYCKTCATEALSFVAAVKAKKTVIESK